MNKKIYSNTMYKHYSRTVNMKKTAKVCMSFFKLNELLFVVVCLF